MEELHFEEFSIKIENTYVTLVIHGKDDTTVKIRSDHVPEIIQFLKEKTEDESNRRAAYRIDIERLCHPARDRLHVLVDDPQKAHIEVTPINISITGILIETTHNIGTQGIHTIVRIDLDNMQALLPATVVRVIQNKVALQFTNSIIDGELNPASELNAICRVLETAWLKSRIK